MSTAAAAPARIREKKITESERLIRTICLEVQPLTRDTFARFGALVGDQEPLDLEVGNGAVHFITQTIEQRPLTFDKLERQRHTERFFAPLGGGLSIIAVAAATDGENPDPNKMAAFYVDGATAFKLHRGTWFTNAFPLRQSAKFLIAESDAIQSADFDVRDLKTTLGIVVEIRH